MLVFVAAAGNGLTLALLSYTFATGDLPFGLEPLVEQKEKQVKKTSEYKLEGVAKKFPSKGEVAEKYAAQLFERLRKKRSELKNKRRNFQEKKKVSSTAVETAKEIEDRLEGKEEKLRALVNFVDEAEKNNAGQTAEILAAMEPAGAADTLMKMDTKRAARVFRLMETRSSAKILAALKEMGAEEGSKKAADILNEFFTVVDNKEGLPGG